MAVLVMFLETVENLQVEVRSVFVALVAAVAERAASICTAFIVTVRVVLVLSELSKARIKRVR